MQHSFDISIAEKYGVNVAIFLNNVAFWIKKNQSNKKHFYQGRYWTYNSQEALTELFPYWSRQNIRTILKSCEDQGLIIKGNFNETGYDRTTWYALTDLGLSLFSCFINEPNSIGENQPIEKFKPTESLVETNQPIPDRNTDIKTDNKERVRKTRAHTKVPVDFLPNDKHALLAAQLGVDLHAEQQAFVDYYTAHGRRMSDWGAAFNNWLRKASTFEKRHNKKPHPVTSILNDIQSNFGNLSKEDQHALIDFMS